MHSCVVSLAFESSGYMYACVSCSSFDHPASCFFVTVMRRHRDSRSRSPLPRGSGKGGKDSFDTGKGYHDSGKSKGVKGKSYDAGKGYHDSGKSYDAGKGDNSDSGTSYDYNAGKGDDSDSGTRLGFMGTPPGSPPPSSDSDGEFSISALIGDNCKIERAIHALCSAYINNGGDCQYLHGIITSTEAAALLQWAPKSSSSWADSD